MRWDLPRSIRVPNLKFLTSPACVCCVKFSRNKRKRQPIGMLGRSSGNHDWLLANASACVCCGFSFTQRTQRTQPKRLRLNGNRASGCRTQSIQRARVLQWRPGGSVDSRRAVSTIVVRGVEHWHNVMEPDWLATRRTETYVYTLKLGFHYPS